MEMSLGFSRDAPLLYRATDDQASLLIYNPDVASRVNACLEAASRCERVSATNELERQHRMLRAIRRDLSAMWVSLDFPLAVIRRPARALHMTAATGLS